MISFRYHLFSIVAVFLALGLGMLAGTTVVDKQLVNGLKQQMGAANQRADLLQSEVGTLQNTLSAVIPPLLADKLAGADVVILQYHGTDGATVNQARNSLQLAGAQLVGEFVVTDNLASPNPSTQAQLASILGVPSSTPPQVLASQTGVALADRMVSRAARPNQDILASLLKPPGFLTCAPGGPCPPDFQAIGGNTILVVLAGGSSAPPVAVGDLLQPLLQEMVKVRGVAAIGQPSVSSYAVVTTLRSDSATDGRIVTVDDLDTQVGGVALALGLHQLLTAGKGGDFGTAGDASSLVPGS